MHVTDVEIVEDRTAGSRADEGFLRVRRLLVRNVYADGGHSEPYACDIVSRSHVDAVAVVLYRIDGSPGETRSVRVVLKEGLRPPVLLRRDKELVRPDLREWLVVTEIAAGVLEESDGEAGGIAARAAAEAHEECGLRVPLDCIADLGGAAFPSPGVTDEKVFFRAAAVDPSQAQRPEGDGSIMEEGTRMVVLELRDAIRKCRSGEIPDMKSEIALLRLCDAIGYVPQLGLFLDELPDALAAMHDRLGVPPA